MKLVCMIGQCEFRYSVHNFVAPSLTRPIFSGDPKWVWNLIRTASAHIINLITQYSLFTCLKVDTREKKGERACEMPVSASKIAQGLECSTRCLWRGLMKQWKREKKALSGVRSAIFYLETKPIIIWTNTKIEKARALSHSVKLSSIFFIYPSHFLQLMLVFLFV